jgi:thiopeptide-type bacteriocin biosynthesis protein
MPEFTPCFFVLRTPLFPATAWANMVRTEIAGALAAPIPREALWLGSPEFMEQADAAGRKANGEGKEGRKERALYRYLSRMAFRATPFGLFAGYSVGEIGKETSLQLVERLRYERKTRLDFEYLHGLVHAIVKLPEARRALRFRVNSSLMGTASGYLYAEGRFDGKRRIYHQVRLDKTPYLCHVLGQAKEGTTGEALVRELLDRYSVTLEEAEGYLGQLVESQVLVPECEPLVTGEEAAVVLAEELSKHETTAAFGKALSNAVQSLAELDREGMGHPPARYEAIAKGLKESLPMPVDIKHLFQTDMKKPVVKATLGEKVVREALKGLEALRKMAVSNPKPEAPLEAFARAFEERYGGQEVSLLTVLDEELGVGFERSRGPGAVASPLLEAVPFGKAALSQDVPWSKRESYLWPLVEETVKSGAVEIELNDKDIETLSNPNPLPLPNAFSVMGTLAAPSCEAANRGHFRIWIHVAAGPSGANLLGRFCPMDEELRQRVGEHLRMEEALKPDAIFAEIIHLPEGRIGNILFRPVLREYEIPFLGHSGAPAKDQIHLQNLLVTVRAGRVILRSSRLGKEVIPRMTTAHNYGLPSNLKAYRFLCLLQNQGVSNALSWDWGLLEQFSFLPRVRYGRIVFSRARWRLRRKEIEILSKGQGEERISRIRAWTATKKIPRFVYLAEGDNELLIDFELPLAVETFAEYVKNRQEAVLVEMYPGPDELCVEGPEGRFVHELVIPFIQTTPPSKTEELSGNAEGPKAVVSSRPRKIFRRSFPPGSEWLYAKLYCGPANADRILHGLIAPLLRQSFGSKAADAWFFIRYNDPDGHLRVRLHGPPQRLLMEVLPALRARAEKALADGVLHRLEMATYEREVERYGGPEGMLLCEKLFQADSEAAVKILENLSGDEGTGARWRLALAGADKLLSDLEMEDRSKLALLAQLKEGYFQEFGGTTALKKAIGDRFRKERALLETLLESQEAEDPSLASGLPALVERTRTTKPVIATLLKKCSQGKITTTLPDLAATLVHMSVNRLMRADARAHEAMIYAFLAQIYESRLARLKGKQVQAGPQRVAP